MILWLVLVALAFIFGMLLGYLLRAFYEGPIYSVPMEYEDILTDYPEVEE